MNLLDMSSEERSAALDDWFGPEEVIAKECIKCHRILPMVAFNYNSKNKDGKAGYCRDCSAEGVRERRKKHIKSWMEWPPYKSRKTDKCFLCDVKGSTTFHHRIPEEKDFEISTFVITQAFNQKNQEKMQRELDKCDEVCDTCHFKAHRKINQDKRDKEIKDALEG